MIPNTIFFALNLVKGPVSDRSNECGYSSAKPLPAKDSREFARIARVRELILAVVRMRACRKVHYTTCMVPRRCKFVPQYSSHCVKVRVSAGTPGLSAAGRILHLTKSFPAEVCFERAPARKCMHFRSHACHLLSQSPLFLRIFSSGVSSIASVFHHLWARRVENQILVGCGRLVLAQVDKSGILPL